MFLFVFLSVLHSRLSKFIMSVSTRFPEVESRCTVALRAGLGGLGGAHCHHWRQSPDYSPGTSHPHLALLTHTSLFCLNCANFDFWHSYPPAPPPWLVSTAKVTWHWQRFTLASFHGLKFPLLGMTQRELHILWVYLLGPGCRNIEWKPLSPGQKAQVSEIIP